MKTWPGGLLTGLLGDLPARFSSDNGRAEFIWLFSAKNCILQGGGGKLNKIVPSVYTSSSVFTPLYNIPATACPK